MNHAIEIIHADMRVHHGYGHSCLTYSGDHVIAALTAADIDPATLPMSPVMLLDVALMCLCWKSLAEEGDA